MKTLRAMAAVLALTVLAVGATPHTLVAQPQRGPVWAQMALSHVTAKTVCTILSHHSPTALAQADCRRQPTVVDIVQELTLALYGDPDVLQKWGVVIVGCPAYMVAHTSTTQVAEEYADIEQWNVYYRSAQRLSSFNFETGDTRWINQELRPDVLDDEAYFKMWLAFRGYHAMPLSIITPEGLEATSFYDAIDIYHAQGSPHHSESGGGLTWGVADSLVIGNSSVAEFPLTVKNDTHAGEPQCKNAPGDIR